MESRLREPKFNSFQGEHCPGHQTIVTHKLLSFSSSLPPKKILAAPLIAVVFVMLLFIAQVFVHYLG
jgi:hypothetical protein